MTVARELATFLVEARFEDLPAQALDHAEMLVMSTLSSAALGTTIDSAKIVRELESERGGTPEATLWFSDGVRLPVAGAARANALASDAAASDDSDLRNIAHIGTPLTASALALAERTQASGKDTVAAMVLGYEAAGRISSAMQCGFKTKGFHGCIIATFAAAAAAARLMRLSVDQTTHALALTATSIGALSAAANTSCAREYHAGMAAMQGVNAALAAGRGYLAEESVFETRSGYFDVYGENADVGAVTRDFGATWSILTDMGIKLVPGGHPNHAVAEAAAQAVIEGNIAPEDIEEITISRPGYQGFANPHAPTDLIGMAHSALYFAAAAAADRHFTWIHAFEDKINNPVIRALLAKVRMIAPPTENLERYKSGAVVAVRTKTGATWTNTVYAPRGAAIRGIDWADVEGKFRALAPYATMSSEQLESVRKSVRGLRNAAQASELTSLLR